MSATYTMDTIIKADESLCISCGSCIRACPGGLITKNEFPVPIPNSWNLCIDCGHCVAICPTGAMHQRAMGPDDCEPIDIHLIPKWDRVQQYLKMRRSIRGYINKPVEKDGLPGRTIPSNSQEKTSRRDLALVKTEDVTLDVRLGQLNDGTTYASNVTLDAKAKNLVVAAQNSGDREHKLKTQEEAE
jgi:ferredoxin